MPIIIFMLSLLAVLALSAKHLINIIPWALQKASRRARTSQALPTDLSLTDPSTSFCVCVCCFTQAQNKYLWMVVSAACYTCSISGLVFDIIRSPPPFHVDRVSGFGLFVEGLYGRLFFEGLYGRTESAVCVGAHSFLSIHVPPTKQ